MKIVKSYQIYYLNDILNFKTEGVPFHWHLARGSSRGGAKEAVAPGSRGGKKILIILVYEFTMSIVGISKIVMESIIRTIVYLLRENAIYGPCFRNT